MKTKFIFIFCLLLSANCQLPLQAQTWNTVGDSTQVLHWDSVTPAGNVFVIKQIDSLLYIGGGFRYAGKIRVNSIATWNGSQWDSIGSGDLSASGVYDICKYNDEIYKGSTWFMRWNGNNWDTNGTGLTTNKVRALKFNNKLYLGGSNIKLYSISQHNIASWDGSNYAGLNGGVTGPFEQVNAITEYNNELIVGGVFNYAGGDIAFNIARWNGINWKALDTGTADIVNSLTVDTINNFLYVGGGFTQVGGIYGIDSYTVARWDGFQWDSLCGTYLENLQVCDALSLCMYHNNLFAGHCGGVNNLTKWDGKDWSIIEGPINSVAALGVYNDELYVGGYNKLIVLNQDTVYGIARYYEPSDTTCDYLQAIIQPKNIVLNISDSTTVHFYNNIILGSSWLWDFGDGETDTVRLPVHTYANGGVFNVSVIVTYLNCTDTAYATVTILDDTGIIKDNKNDSIEYLGNNIPNPFDNSTSIPYYIPNGSKGFLQITDAKGELVDEYALQQGKNKLDVSLAQFKAGIYYYSLVLDGVVKQTKKMVLQ